MWTPDGKYILDKAVIFKGATRPACIMGIPMTPFIFVAGAIMIISFIVWIPLLLSLVPTLWLMRNIAKDDDQRFLQLFLAYKTNFIGSRKVAGYNCINESSYKKAR